MRVSRLPLNFARLLLVVFAIASCGCAQDVPRLRLKVKEKLPVSSLAGSIGMSAPKCDGEGNIYFRPMISAPADPLSGPIIRISADGRKVVNIDLNSATDFGDNTHIHTWAVGLRGEVHVIADKDQTPRFVHYGGGDIYFVHFDDEGRFRSSTRLDSRFYALHMAVFPTGEILAATEKTPEKPGGPRGEPFTAIFDRNGKLIKELSFAGDVKRKAETATEHPGAVISLGEAIPADDGNIYLLRATEKPLILVVSPAGELVRSMHIDLPEEGFHPGHMQVAGGKIVMEFYKPGRDQQTSGTYIYSSYDAETGERQIDYEPTAKAKGIFACYTPNQFTFLSVDEKGLFIVHAAPR